MTGGWMRWVLLGLVGCAGQGEDGKKGRDGEAGLTGPTGPTGPAGPAGGGFRWHDATGAPVTAGGELAIFDEQGNLWPLNPETGEVAVEAFFRRFLYTERDCTGTEYASGPALPRLVMIGIDGESAGKFYVRSDAARLESVEIRGEAYTGSCVAVGAETTDAVPFADLVEVIPPDTPWTGPLHPELVE